MPTVEAIVNGQTYTLSDGSPFALIDADGGMAAVNRITERGPDQHGDTDVDFRLEATTWPLGLLAYATDIASHYAVRDLALRIFRPSRQPLQLRWTLETGAVRQLDCHVAGQLVFRSQDSRGFSQRFVVPLRAADPTYYDPVALSVTYGVGVGGGTWAIPWAIPWAIGASALSGSRAVLNPGTWQTQPTIIVTGPITSPVITNVTTGDVLDFTGYSLAAGQTLTIDTRYGVKTVTRDDGSSQIDKLTDDSDLATFRLAADPDAPGGVNTISVAGSAATTATEVYLQFNPRYIGF